MITPQQACNIVCLRLPDLTLDENCVDYRGCWAFTYTREGQDPFFATANRIFVDQRTGTTFLADPLFDVELWSKSKNVSSEVDFSDCARLQKLGSFIARPVG